jgi:hypothetical protein
MTKRINSTRGTLSVRMEVILGMEVWSVRLNGKVERTRLSEGDAVIQMYTLQQQFNREDCIDV